MKISVISDTHLGVKWGTELEEDSFNQFEEAVKKSIEEKVDLILIPGDIFDVRLPKQEVWARALKSFQKHLLAEKTNARLKNFIGEHENISKMTLQGIPIIAIYGNHEIRGSHQVNPVQLLEKAGYLIYLNKNGVVFEKNNEKIAVQGLSAVAENEVKEILKEWNPKPVEGAFNIFLFHQSTTEEIYDPDNTFLSLNDLPLGFDLYIDGHIHWRKWVPEKKFLIPGSTVITQMKQKEAEQGKGFYLINTSPFEVKFVKLDNQRPFYFKKIELIEANQLKLNDAINYFLNSIPESVKKPLVKIKLKGKMEKGKKASQLSFNEFKKKENMIINIDNEIESEDLKKTIEKLREMHSNKKSVDEMGNDLIKELLKQTNYNSFNVSELIEPLADGNTSYLMNLIEKQLNEIRQEIENN